jgi:hypothetical protein
MDNEEKVRVGVEKGANKATVDWDFQESKYLLLISKDGKTIWAEHFDHWEDAANTAIDAIYEGWNNG